MDYYKILNVSPNASDSEIKNYYLTDVFSNDSDGFPKEKK